LPGAAGDERAEEERCRETGEAHWMCSEN
jgi:hypothetical protein